MVKLFIFSFYQIVKIFSHVQAYFFCGQTFVKIYVYGSLFFLYCKIKKTLRINYTTCKNNAVSDTHKNTVLFKFHPKCNDGQHFIASQCNAVHHCLFDKRLLLVTDVSMRLHRFDEALD